METTFPEGFFNKQPWMRGAQGHDGLVFLRTGPQTFYTNEQMTDFGELRLPVAFFDKWCRSFIDDMQGHYLLASERGVFRFDYALKETMNLGYGEGLRGDFINDMRIGSDGRLWVATSQGLFTTSLDSIDTWRKEGHYKVRLFNIRRGSDLMSSTDEYMANENHDIRLCWNFTSEALQAEVLLPDYSCQRNRLYEYRIGGGNWQTVDDGQPMDIRRLELGTNLLEVRLAGIESSASLYTVRVMPSVWAVVELIFLLLAVVLLWLWWRWRKTTKVLLKERHEIEDALIESEEVIAELSDEMERSVKSEDKYQKVKLNEEECTDIVARMKEYIERERVYTNAYLKMSDLADELGVLPSKLSLVFNQHLGQSYYDFINGYRLKAFKQLIEQGAYKRFTLTALSEQCGFKRANFFSTFRKVEGMTPAEYLKKVAKD